MQSIHTNNISLLLFASLSSFLHSTPTQLSFTIPFTITGFANKTTFFLTDATDNQFVLKYHPRGPRRAIHDALGAYIGKSIGLRINEVEIFSAHHPFNSLFSDINPLNSSQIGITTLHSRIPGKAIREMKSMDEEIAIKCGIRKEQTIANIIQYQELCDIIAFDIFIDNTDRHNGNIFFNKKTGHFYIFDMDHGFKSAFTLAYTSHDYDFNIVATRTYRYIKTLKKRKLSAAHVQALKQVQQTLQKLINLYPPAILFEEWMLLAEKANVFYTVRDQEKIKKYLIYHAHEVERLITLLDEIL